MFATRDKFIGAGKAIFENKLRHHIGIFSRADYKGIDKHGRLFDNSQLPATGTIATDFLD